MSIFGKNSGGHPADESEVWAPDEKSDFEEELSEIEKARRDLMVARLETFKREADEQAAAESTSPDTEEDGSVLEEKPITPPAAQYREKMAEGGESFITRSALPIPTRKPPQQVETKIKPEPKATEIPEKLPEPDQLIAEETQPDKEETPTGRTPLKVEAKHITPVADKTPRQEKPEWRAPPQLDKEPIKTDIGGPIVEKPVRDEPIREDFDGQSLPEVTVPTEPLLAEKNVIRKTVREADAEEIKIQKPTQYQVNLPYGEVPQVVVGEENVDREESHIKKKNDTTRYLEISDSPPEPTATDLGESTEIKSLSDIEAASEEQINRSYPQTSGRYNQYDHYNRNKDKLIDDIMFGIVNADIATCRRQMNRSES